MSKSKRTVYIFTDGACSGNPGPGGWGAVLQYKGSEKQIKGWSKYTTNNRMEVLAAIRALEALKMSCKVVIATDSNYLKKGITDWISVWKRNGWQTVTKNPVKNKELWQALDSLCRSHTVHWEWVRGHAGHPKNELADQLAKEAMSEGVAGEMKEDMAGRLDSSAGS